MEIIKRFEQIKNLNDGLSTLMVLCMAVYGGDYTEDDIANALDSLVDSSDYRKSDRDAIVTSLVNLTKKHDVKTKKVDKKIIRAKE